MSEGGMFDGLGQVLLEARNELGDRQGDVAARAGISGGMLSAYEQGKATPKLETLDKVLGALGLDVEELGRRLRLRQGGGRPELPGRSGWVPGRTADAAAELLEQTASLFRLAVQRPAPAKRVRRRKRRAGKAGDEG